MKRTGIIAIMFLIAFVSTAQERSGTKVIAHRGAWKNTNFPQNSMGALKAAIAMRCFASECDIWMTSDSVLVVNHDPDFFELPIESTTYHDLLSRKYSNGESIATLREFLTAVSGQQSTRLVLDIKPSKISKERSIVTAKKCYDMVVAAGAKDIVDYILFDYDAALALEELDPGANIAYLNGDKSPAQVADDGLWGIDYSYRVFEKNPTWVGDAKKRKLTVNVWTVNDVAMSGLFIQQGVDFITTDEPEKMLEAMRTVKR